MNTSATPPSFFEVAEFVRDFAGLRGADTIAPETRLDVDLGITGLDGDDLLAQAATRFNATLAGHDGYISTFGLAPNEYLFHSEGLPLPGIGALKRLLGNPEPVVRDLTVGQLHDAIRRHGHASNDAGTRAARHEEP